MLRLWRLCRAAHQPLDGEGAGRYGGRWNSEGHAVVYLSSSLSLAALECLVHVDARDAPHDYVALEVNVPDDVAITAVQLAELPDDWNATPDHPACVRLGDDWIAAGATLLLRVPSAVIPHEHNVLMNPRHRDAGRVRVASSTPFRFDARLLSTRASSE